MPKYRFVTDDGDRLDTDRDWLELPNDQAAAQEAQRALADMTREKLPDGSQFNMRVSVENEAGTVVYQASLTFEGETAADMEKNAANAERASMNGSRHPSR